MSIKDFDDIDVSTKVDDAIERGLLKYKKEKQKRSIKNKTKMYGLTASVVGVVSIGMATPAVASRVPFIGNAFKQISSVTKEDQSKYATAVNKTVTSNGVSVTVSQVLADDQTLYISYAIKSDKILAHGYINKYAQIMEESKTSLSFSDKSIIGFGPAGFEGTFVNENTFVGMMKFDLTQFKTKIPDKFTITQKFTGIADIDENLIKGEWNFKIPVTVDKSIDRVISTNIENGGYKISRIYVNPYDMVIEKNLNGEDKLQNEMDMYSITAYNDDGTKIKESSENAHMLRLDAPKKGSKYIRVLVRKPKPCKYVGNGIYETQGYYKPAVLDVKIPLDNKQNVENGNKQNEVQKEK